MHVRNDHYMGSFPAVQMSRAGRLGGECLRLLPDLHRNATACIAVTFSLPGYVTIQGIRIAREDRQRIQSE